MDDLLWIEKDVEKLMDEHQNEIEEIEIRILKEQENMEDLDEDKRREMEEQFKNQEIIIRKQLEKVKTIWSLLRVADLSPKKRTQFKRFFLWLFSHNYQEKYSLNLNVSFPYYKIFQCN